MCALSLTCGLRRQGFNIVTVLLWLVFSTWSDAVSTSVGGRADNQIDTQIDEFHWVATWTAMPQLVEPANLPPEPFVCFESSLHKGAEVVF